MPRIWHTVHYLLPCWRSIHGMAITMPHKRWRMLLKLRHHGLPIHLWPILIVVILSLHIRVLLWLVIVFAFLLRPLSIALIMMAATHLMIHPHMWLNLLPSEILLLLVLNHNLLHKLNWYCTLDIDPFLLDYVFVSQFEHEIHSRHIFEGDKSKPSWLACSLILQNNTIFDLPKVLEVLSECLCL